MSMSTEEKIRHYQRSIDRSILDKSRLLHCIEILSKLPVTVQHLQVTGIGRTVNALRKIENGVGDAAKRLVAKWKIMVANTDTSEEEDEACVPDVPESYESPECDSESENIINESRGSNIIPPEALRRPVLSPSIILDEDILSNTSPSTSNNHIASDDEEKLTSHNISKAKSKIKSLDINSKFTNSKHLCHKGKGSKKESKSKRDKHKDESAKVNKNNLKDPENIKNKKKDKDKNKIESCTSSSSSKNKKFSDDEKHRKRTYDSSSSDAENDIKKKKKLESEEENAYNEEYVINDEGSEDEKNCRMPSLDSQLKEKSSLKSISQSDKEKLKEKHRNSSSHGKIKKHESSEKLKKDEKQSSSKSNECAKERKYKNDEQCNKESLKLTSSSSSNRDHSKIKYKDKDKHNKDKVKESNSKSHKEEKNTTKDDRGKCKENNEVKEHKESKSHKVQKEHKEKKKTKKSGYGGIDCNSGTSFADALGMCTMLPPSKKKKESISLNLSKSSKIDQPSAQSSPVIPSSSKCVLHKVKSEPDSPESLPLLSSNVKLEPLSRIDEEVDLASTLPEPSPHYKPLPHLNHAQRRQDEDNMLSQVIYAKNQRTKVYSGNKIGYTNVPSLYEMCIRVLIENIDALEFTGGVPYYIIKPVLERATPDQLFILEHHNPYLIEDSDPLWKFHCSKDFRTKQREEMETWREMYMRCLDEREAKLKALTANIKQSIDKSTPVRSTKLAYVDNVVKPPRNVLRKQAKYGTANSSSKVSDLKKKLIATSGSCSSSSGNSGSMLEERITVPPPPVARIRSSSSSTLKKTKAPLMAKALQAIKGRYKR
ncbi:PREDICTED: transcription elongation factor B polypeptide 3 [Ceratosolen solmsi marchali]|uniref:Transcription elongation factor B polypeptide 3 n=1 Tax=Ceratosolen solmsi marchali TaxID=326594 RepID=A0AAJ6YQA6_9HYME|nr:PREDICTED: transcription elongation factor B polypeptide 3 [Ceratosolen solmsi marchali]